MDNNDVVLTVDDFGTLKEPNAPEQVIKCFTWKSSKIIMKVITYGATIKNIMVPDKTGTFCDVVMGYDDMEGYRTSSNPYFGATVGRVANRTGNSMFSLNLDPPYDGVYHLNSNAGKNHLHGGLKGFDKVNWKYFVNGNRVIFSYLSKAGEEGYPGSVLSHVSYEILDGRIKIEMSSKTSEPTPINLTNHSYFNLAGHDAGPSKLLEHVLTINADGYTPLNEELVTTGEVKPLSELNLKYDISKPTILKDIMSPEGFDLNFCIKKSNSDTNFIAKVSHPSTGIYLKMYGNQPGVQFYTSNFLPEDGSQTPIIGKNQVKYIKQGAFCLEPQNYPNAINHPSFPNSILLPGEQYIHNIHFEFGVEE